MNDSIGFLYIATGDNFVEEARISAQTIDEHHPNIPICLVTDREVTCPIFDRVIQIENPKYGFEDQIYNLDKTPFDRTICIDTDIYADDSIADVFDILDEYDLAVTHNHDGNACPVDNVPEAFPELSTGVVAYRLSDQFQEVLSIWKETYKNQPEKIMQNQPAFRKAVYESNIRFATLRREYNCVFRAPGYAVGRVKLFHGRLQPIDGPGAGEYFDIETAVEVINQTDRPRVFTQLGGITVHTNKTDSLLHRARLSFRKHGLNHVLVEGFKLIREKFD